jgi:hypothetical protein
VKRAIRCTPEEEEAAIHAGIASIRTTNCLPLSRRPFLRINECPTREALLEKIKALPVERIAEIEDFVDFIAAREQERSFTRAVSAASAPSFAAVWNNPEDDVYDAL